MNPMDVHEFHDTQIAKRTLELITTEGYSTRKAKRQAEKEARQYWNKKNARRKKRGA